MTQLQCENKAMHEQSKILSSQNAMLASFLLIAGCAPGVSGTVLDAATGDPIAGAKVEIHDNGWGFRNGNLNWDVKKITSTKTGPDGTFTLDSDGGYSLRIAAPGKDIIQTSLCSRSPSIVRVGGAYSTMRPEKILVFQQTDKTGVYEAQLENVTLRASGDAFADGPDGPDGPGFQITSDTGIHFMPGTGSIPAPPALPYSSSLELDLSYCGWLFVSNGTTPIAAIKVRPLSWRQQQPLMQYAKFTYQ